MGVKERPFCRVWVGPTVDPPIPWVMLERTAEVARRIQPPHQLSRVYKQDFTRRCYFPNFILGVAFDGDYSTNSCMAWLRAFGA
jgi:hypothetical protein